MPLPARPDGPVPDPPSLDAVVFRLTDRSLARYAWLGRISVCEPPLSPVGFETRMAQALSSLSDEEVRHWLKHELKAQVDDMLSASVLRRRGIFDHRGVQHLIDLDRAGRVDASYPIFAIMCIETWCRRYVDTSGSAF